MRRFGRRESEPARERVPRELPAKCLGKACLNFTGVTCKSHEELLNADGRSGRKDRPPFRDEATYALYGQVCTGGNKEKLVAQRALTLGPRVNPMMLIALAGRYGDLPLSIESATGKAYGVRTIASSDKKKR